MALMPFELLSVSQFRSERDGSNVIKVNTAQSFCTLKDYERQDRFRRFH